MAVLARHVVQQRKMVAALGGIAVDALLQRFDRRAPRDAVLPREPITARVPSPSRSLVRDYLRYLGAAPDAYEGVIPPQLFPQWCLPLAARTLRGLPLPLLKIVNSGCRLEHHAVLNAAGALHVSASLQSVDSDEARTVLRQRIVTSQPSREAALVAELRAVVPSAIRGRRGAREPVRVPADAERLTTWTLDRNAGRNFAWLTGDFNPIHWSARYARALGFEGALMHGFATMARVFTGLESALFDGRSGQLAVLDVRFTRPLTLPACVGLFVKDGAVFVGLAGEPAYLAGTFETRAGTPRARNATDAAREVVA